MENLTKQQITLLCLLVALFTSIATSVITVSLSDSTSTGFTNTVYKVVERTIQEVTPKDSPVRKIIVEKNDTPDTKTLSVSDIAVDATKNLVTVWQKDVSNENVFVTNGAVVDSGNILVLRGEFIDPNSSYIVKLPNGKFVEMIRKNVSLPGEMALLNYKNNSSDNPSLKGFSLGSMDDVKLGENVIAVGSKEDNNVVSTGIIKEVVNTSDKNSDKKDFVLTDITLSDPSSGWILFDTSGDLIGFIVVQVGEEPLSKYIDASKIKSAL